LDALPVISDLTALLIQHKEELDEFIVKPDNVIWICMEKFLQAAFKLDVNLRGNASTNRAEIDPMTNLNLN